MIPVVRRAEMLAEIMRLKWAIAVGGTHGKTTTTSIVATLLDTANLDPTVINGGIINAYGTNAHLGEGDWIVVEADESDGSFVKLPSTIAVVTNIDAEHMDFYGSFESLRQAFVWFVENIPFYGFAVLCIDHPEVQALIGEVSDRRIITYGMSPQADIRATRLEVSPGVSRFDVVIGDRASGETRTLERVELPMVGAHNVQNALAGIAIAQEIGIEDEVIRRALAAARAGTAGKVIAVVQPHRYSRLGDLFEEFCTCFNDADTVIVADVYAAGEAPIEGIDRDALVAGLQARGHRDAVPLKAPEDLAGIVAGVAAPGDIVVCLGAGNITQWANALPAELDARRGKKSAKRSGKPS